MAEWARREADKEAAAACKAHSQIVFKIRQLTEWMTSLRLRHLRLQVHRGRIGPGAGAGLRYDLHHAAEWGEELSFRLLSG